MTSLTAPTSPADRVFAALRRSSVTRSPHGALGGVCTGVADQFGFSVKATRVVTVLLAFAGAAIPLYLLAWLLLPDRTGAIHLERALRGGRIGSIALLVATVLALLPDAHVHHHTGWEFLPVIAVVGVVAFLIARSRGRGPAAGRRTDGPQDVLHP